MRELNNIETQLVSGADERFLNSVRHVLCGTLLGFLVDLYPNNLPLAMIEGSLVGLLIGAGDLSNYKNTAFYTLLGTAIGAWTHYGKKEIKNKSAHTHIE